MLRICSAVVVCAALLGGCAQVQQATDFLASPKTSQAANNVGKIVTAVACAVEATSSGAAGVDKQVGGDAQSQQIIQTIYVASAATCKLIGGLVQGTATVPAADVTKVVQ